MEQPALGPAEVPGMSPLSGTAGAGRTSLRGFTLAMMLLVLAGTAILVWRELDDDAERASATARRRIDRLADELGQLVALADAAVGEADAGGRPGPIADPARHRLLARLPIPLQLQALDANTAAAAPAALPTAPGWAVTASAAEAAASPPAASPSPSPSPAGLALLRRASPNDQGIAAWRITPSPEALQRRLGAELQGPQDTIALLLRRPDGSLQVLAQVPAGAGDLVRGLTGLPQAEALQRGLVSVPEAPAGADGVRRALLYRAVPLPAEAGPAALVLAHGLARPDPSASENATLAMAAGLAGLLVLGIGYVGWRLDRLLATLARQKAALGRSAAQFRALAENLPDPVVRLDADGRHLYVNRAVVGATGLSPEAFLGKTNADLGMPADNVAAWQATLREAFATGKPQRLGFVYPGPDGPRHWESLVLREPAQPREPATALVISRDVTEREQAAERLARSERHLREAQRIAGLGHWSLDLATGQMQWSDELYRLFGQVPGSFQPSVAAVEALTHPEDRTRLQAAMQEAMRGPRRVSMRHRITRADGVLRHLQVEGEAEFDTDGQPRRCLGTVQDVTERQQAEDEIRRLADALAQRVQERTDQLALSEQRYRMIFEAAPVAIGEEDWSDALALLRDLRARGIDDAPAYFTDHPDFVRQCLRAVRMVRANPAAQALIARHAPLPAATGLQGLEAFYPDAQTLPMFIDELCALWRGDRHYADKRTIPSREGPPMQLMLTVALPSIDETHGTAMACLVDIGELDRLNAELDRSVARLRRVNQELETFTYSVSHDLKAPLRGIDGYSRLLLADHRDQLDEEGRDFLERIRQATQHMGTLTDDLLAYSRLERHALQLVTLPLAPLVQRVLAGFEADCRALDVALTVDVPDTLQVRADDPGLTMALRNLVDNALKFSRDRRPPRLVVRAAAGGLGVQLTVEDNGVGFDMKYQDRIFAIFQRLHRAEDYPGTGIGLAIVRKAVERMGGQVRAHGVPGQGATFTIELPTAGHPPAG